MDKLSRTLATSPARAAAAWHRAHERFALAAIAADRGPGSQHLSLALDRAAGRLVAAQAELLQALDSIPAAVALADVLVVVAPDVATAALPRSQWSPDGLCVVAVPKESILWHS